MRSSSPVRQVPPQNGLDHLNVRLEHLEQVPARLGLHGFDPDLPTESPIEGTAENLLHETLSYRLRNDLLQCKRRVKTGTLDALDENRYACPRIPQNSMSLPAPGEALSAILATEYLPCTSFVN